MTKNKLYVFIGKPMTGKSTLADHFMKDIEIIDDFVCDKDNCKDIVTKLLTKYKDRVIITHCDVNDEALDELLGRIKYITASYDVTICKFEAMKN